jgi:hypothetical protein
MGAGRVGVFCTAHYGSVSLSSGLFEARSSSFLVIECPWTSIALMLLGALVVVRLAFRTLYVLMYTFVLPGKNVSLPCRVPSGCR